jgi:hypothetical protein
MRMLWRSESGAGIAVQTWAFWSFHSYLTVMYFGFVAVDLWMAFLFFLSGSCTTWIAMVAARKQKHFKAKYPNHPPQIWDVT